MHTYAHICTPTHRYAHVRTHRHTYAFVCTPMYMYRHIHIHTHSYAHEQRHMYMYAHICTYTRNNLFTVVVLVGMRCAVTAVLQCNGGA